MVIGNTATFFWGEELSLWLCGVWGVVCMLWWGERADKTKDFMSVFV